MYVLFVFLNDSSRSNFLTERSRFESKVWSLGEDTQLADTMPPSDSEDYPTEVVDDQVKNNEDEDNEEEAADVEEDEVVGESLQA
jgi:hypothetical protein